MHSALVDDIDLFQYSFRALFMVLAFWIADDYD